MKPFLYERIAQALLIEMASGFYRDGEKFLSIRDVCHHWSVSKPTAKSAIQHLVQHDLIEPVQRSGLILRPGFRQRALYMLNANETTAATAPSTWQNKRQQLLANVASRRSRLAIIFDFLESETSDPGSLSAAALKSSPRSIAIGIMAQCEQLELQPEFFCIIHKSDMELIHQLLDQGRFDALLLIKRSKQSTLSSILNSLLSRSQPLMTVFHNCEGTEAYAVDVNNVGIGTDAAKAMLEKKPAPSRFICIRPRSSNPSFTERADGFRKSLLDAGVHEDQISTFSIGLENTLDRKLKSKLVTEPGTAIGIYFAMYDDLKRFRRIFNRRNLIVGENVHITLTSATAYVPGTQYPIDLMHFDFARIGATAIHQIQQILRGLPTHKMTLVRLLYLAWSEAKSVRLDPQQQPLSLQSASR